MAFGTIDAVFPVDAFDGDAIFAVFSLDGNAVFAVDGHAGFPVSPVDAHMAILARSAVFPGTADVQVIIEFQVVGGQTIGIRRGFQLEIGSGIGIRPSFRSPFHGNGSLLASHIFHFVQLGQIYCICIFRPIGHVVDLLPTHGNIPLGNLDLAVFIGTAECQSGPVEQGIPHGHGTVGSQVQIFV